MIRGLAGQNVGAQMVNAATGGAFVGAVMVYVTGDGGTQTLGGNNGGVCTAEGNGFFNYQPLFAETNYAIIAFTFVGTGAVPATIQVATVSLQTAAALSAASPPTYAGGSPQFINLYSELAGYQPLVSPFLAQKWINRAWRDILSTREWSFLIAEGGFNAPSVIQAGSFSITQNLPTVVADATLAGPAINAVAAAVPPITQYQIRFGLGALYNIVSWNNATLTLTLDRPVLEATQATQTYLCYQAYFYPPSVALQLNGLYDFDRWISVLDPVNGIQLEIDTSKDYLDWKDPQRTVSDLAYGVFDYKADALGNQLYEFWPHPTAGQQFVCQYRRRGLAFSVGNQALPQMIPEALIINRALYRYLYPWCQQQAGREPKFARVNWGSLITQSRGEYKDDLQAAKLQDENVHLTALVKTPGRQTFPASFYQSHDPLFIMSRG